MGGDEKRISSWEFFLLFVKIGIFTIGGGYVMIPLMQKEFVEKRKLMSVEEFLNIIALAQCGPGGVAINASTVVGYRIKGYWGALLATAGTVFPSFLAILLLAFYLLKHGNAEGIEKFLLGARPAVVGLLLASSYSLGKEAVKDKKAFSLLWQAFWFWFYLMPTQSWLLQQGGFWACFFIFQGIQKRKK
ncbi:MAG: Chromate transporter [Clostridia bacterium 41_269]|nr:MAG: Chromate transporter [Clostridia bacterium 41_269]